jgi:NAD(P)-dependent dehydrogenase (short-subunit alcohol dehydrogenase family)
MSASGMSASGVSGPGVSGRTVLITGASGGIGRGVALACAEVGWTVWIAARREAEAGAVAHEVTAAGGVGHAVVCDVGDEASVAAAVAAVADAGGGLDGVVHNATSGLSSRSGSLLDITVDELEDHVRVSVRGCYLLARAAAPLLTASRGSFVVMTSEAGFEGKRLLAAYATVKAAQRGLVRVLAREWGPAGVRVNAVAPLGDSPAMAKAFVSDPRMQARVMSRIPLERLGDAVTDIGPAVRFLLSDDARYVTGQTLMVDGGSCSIA